MVIKYEVPVDVITSETYNAHIAIVETFDNLKKEKQELRESNSFMREYAEVLERIINDEVGDLDE